MKNLSRPPSPSPAPSLLAAENSREQGAAGPGTQSWFQICAIDDIPPLGARVVRNGSGDIAVFRDAEDEVYALADRCPHKGGKLSQGIVFGDKVSCPLHAWVISLRDGKAVAPDEGCATTFPVKVEKGQVFLRMRDEE